MGKHTKEIVLDVLFDLTMCVVALKLAVSGGDGYIQ